MIKCCLQLSALNWILYIFCHCSLKDLKTIYQSNKWYLPKSTWWAQGEVQQTEKDTRQDWNVNESASQYKFAIISYIVINVTQYFQGTVFTLVIYLTYSTVSEGHCGYTCPLQSCSYWSSWTKGSLLALAVSCTHSINDRLV